MRFGSGRGAIKLLATASVAAATLVVAPSAGAAVTIGQTGTPDIACGAFDRVQPTVLSGASYVVPPTVANGTITSWSTEAGAGPVALGMKVYRPLGADTYQVVGQSGPNDLTANALNTFPTKIAVRAGDVLGNTTPDTGAICTFTAIGETYFRRAGSLPVGAQGTFELFSGDRRLNVSAVVDPVNTITLGAITRNKKKGTALLPVTVPNPGTLSLSGGGAVARVASGPVAGKSVTSPGTIQLSIKAKSKKKKATLNSTGKVKVGPTITFTPTGGTAKSQAVSVKLKKNI